MPHHHTHRRAIACALSGFTCWVIGDSFMKLVSASGVPKYEITAIGGVSGMISIFALTALRGELRHLRPRRYGGLAALSVLFLLGYLFYLLGLPHMPLTSFYAIVFMAPILIAGLAALIFREPLGVRQGLAVLAGFGGVLMAINPVNLWHNTGDWIGIGAAFAAMLCLTMQMLLIRLLGRSESRECMAFYPRLGPFLGGLIAIGLWGAAPMSIRDFLYCFAVGAIGGIGWVLVAHAYKIAPAVTIAPFQYSEIIVGAVIGYYIWGDVPSMHLVTGVAVIIAAGIYIVKHTRRSAVTPPVETV